MSVDSTDPLYADVETLWKYHRIHDELRPCSVGIGLGSHDLGVATFSAQLFHRRMFPLLLFTGANSQTSRALFPRGEAVHYREEAITLGVPSDAIIVEARAANTEQNITFARQLLADRGVDVRSVLLISKPYQQRRAYATCKRVWREVEVVCASEPLSLPDYIAGIGDAARVIDMLVGETQRIMEYPKLGHTIEQEMPPTVRNAFTNLVQAGYISRLIRPGQRCVIEQ